MKNLKCIIGKHEWSQWTSPSDLSASIVMDGYEITRRTARASLRFCPKCAKVQTKTVEPVREVSKWPESPTDLRGEIRVRELREIRVAMLELDTFDNEHLGHIRAGLPYKEGNLHGWYINEPFPTTPELEEAKAARAAEDV